MGCPKSRPEPGHAVKEVVFGVHPRNPIDPQWACGDRRTEKLREQLSATVSALWGTREELVEHGSVLIALQTNKSDLCSWGSQTG